jgi:hypothetical protein
MNQFKLYIHVDVIRNPLYSYLKQAKISGFFFLFSFYKIEEQEGRTGAAQACVCVCGTSGKRGSGGERGLEGEYSANTVHTCM